MLNKVNKLKLIWNNVKERKSYNNAIKQISGSHIPKISIFSVQWDTNIAANQMQIQNVLKLLSWVFLQQQLRS